MKRIINKQLLEESREWECVICGRIDTGMAHHVFTVGSGGNDVEWNLMPLCLKHHCMVHTEGLNKMAKNRKIITWLKENDWYFNEPRGRWIHD